MADLLRQLLTTSEGYEVYLRNPEILNITPGGGAGGDRWIVAAGHLG